MSFEQCPYLGIESDPETAMAFATAENFCHHVKQPEEVSLPYQSAYCLNSNYRRCSVFAKKDPDTLPKEAAAHPKYGGAWKFGKSPKDKKAKATIKAPKPSTPPKSKARVKTSKPSATKKPSTPPKSRAGIKTSKPSTTPKSRAEVVAAKIAERDTAPKSRADVVAAKSKPSPKPSARQKPTVAKKPKTPREPMKPAIFWSFIAVFLIAIFFIFGGWDWTQTLLAGITAEKPTAMVYKTATSAPTNTIIATSAPVTSLPSPTLTVLPSPTNTFTPIAIFPPTATYTPIPCEPPSSWVPYIIQPGDTLYALAKAFGITVNELQAGNCMVSTYIWAGQTLYVPNVPTITPTPSNTPTSTATPSDTPTPTLTLTPTETPTPTDTPTPSDTPTSTATPSNTPTATLEP